MQVAGAERPDRAGAVVGVDRDAAELPVPVAVALELVVHERVHHPDVHREPPARRRPGPSRRARCRRATTGRSRRPGSGCRRTGRCAPAAGAHRRSGSRRAASRTRGCRSRPCRSGVRRRHRGRAARRRPTSDGPRGARRRPRSAWVGVGDGVEAPGQRRTHLRHGHRVLLPHGADQRVGELVAPVERRPTRSASSSPLHPGIAARRAGTSGGRTARPTRERSRSGSARPWTGSVEDRAGAMAPR